MHKMATAAFLFFFFRRGGGENVAKKGERFRISLFFMYFDSPPSHFSMRSSVAVLFFYRSRFSVIELEISLESSDEKNTEDSRSRRKSPSKETLKEAAKTISTMWKTERKKKRWKKLRFSVDIKRLAVPGGRDNMQNRLVTTIRAFCATIRAAISMAISAANSAVQQKCHLRKCKSALHSLL